MSRRRLCVRISNCSRLFLSTCGERLTGELLDAGGQRNRFREPGHRSVSAVVTISSVRRIENPMVERLEPYANILAVHCRYLSCSVMAGLVPGHPRLKRKSWMPGTRPGMTTDSFLLDDGCDDAGTDGAAASRIAKRSFSSIAIGTIQVHLHCDVVARHHHLGAFGQMHDAGHVRGAEVELRPVVGEERGVTAALPPWSECRPRP